MKVQECVDIGSDVPPNCLIVLTISLDLSFFVRNHKSKLVYDHVSPQPRNKKKFFFRLKKNSDYLWSPSINLILRVIGPQRL